MKIVRFLISYVSGILLLLILFITSIELVTYVDKGFYEREYAKYDVLEDVKMKMDDVLHVTDEMMAYLHGNRDDLVIKTTVNGETREFFNDREKAHMADVKVLFLAGLFVRRAALIALIACVAALLLLKAKLREITAFVILKTFLVFDMISLIIVALASQDFTKYFTMFHQIFFNNDLWLLDPATDLLINILPEGFFIDIAIEILLVFLVMQITTVLLSFLWKGKRAK